MPITVRLFAALREHRGETRLTVDAVPGETVRQLFERLFPDRPGRDWPGPLMYAVAQEYVDADHVLGDGDEVAFVPPLGGGSDRAPRVLLSTDPIELQPLIDRVSGPTRGGLCCFTGTVRDHHLGRGVVHLEYEAYEPMALSEMERVCDEIERRWEGSCAAISHRLGTLQIGDAAVHVAVAGGHRVEVFEACRFGIDELKRTVPIFKKEVYADGSTWKGQGGG